MFRIYGKVFNLNNNQYNMKIYTRTGDRGMTRINGGERVAKTSQRIETNGAIDELNAILGIVRVNCNDATIDKDLYAIQRNLMVVMSIIATPSIRRKDNPRRLSDSSVEELENKIDNLEVDEDTCHCFVLPGGTVVSSFLHLARTICRRAEREVWRLDESDRVEEIIKIYLNRLSDYLFILASWFNRENELVSGGENWNKFGDAYIR